jgi:hypothetical protein
MAALMEIALVNSTKKLKSQFLLMVLWLAVIMGTPPFLQVMLNDKAPTLKMPT